MPDAKWYSTRIYVTHAEEQYGTEIQLELGFTYTPGHPATPPSYSHGGLPPDPEECLLEAIFLKGSEHKPENDLYELLCHNEAFIERMEEKYAEEVSQSYARDQEPDPDAERDRWQDEQEHIHRKELEGKDW